MRFRYRFLNWEKYNPNSTKRHHWCRLDAGLIHDEVLMEASYNARWLFITMLCRAIDGKGEANMTSSFVYQHTKMRQHQFITYLSAWQAAGMIEYKILDDTAKSVLQTDRQTDSTDNYEGVTVVPTPSKKKTNKPKPEKQPKEPSSTMELWQVYAEAWKARYDNEPKRNAMTTGQAKQLVSRLGLEDAKEVVRYYLQQDDRYYEQQAYTLGPCLKNCEALLAKLQAETPKPLTPEVYEAMGYKIIEPGDFPEPKELF